MTPHLVRWHDEWKDAGLVIIEVNNGRMDSLDELRQHIDEHGIRFAVLHDVDGQVCDAFGVRGYPAAYLIGRDGRVVWQGHPQGEAAETVLRQALATAET
jgi:peroxiredoxin